MSTLEDARRLALALPDTDEKLSWGHPMFRVRGKGFVWERPLRAKDRAELGESAPAGPILGVRIADVAERPSLIAAQPEVYFTIEHFANHPAALVRLDAVDDALLREIVEEAWLLMAPVRLREQWLAEHPAPGD